MSYRAHMAVLAATSVVIVGATVALVSRDGESWTSHRLKGPQLVAFESAVAAAGVANPSLDEAEPAEPPATLTIPSIGVIAPVTRLGLERDGTLEVPDSYTETGWWSGGVKPGQSGPAVIVGHVDSETGPAVFANLNEVERGDVVQVSRADGSTVDFEIKRIEEHEKADFPTTRVYGGTADPELRLMTCGGEFDESKGHYERNVIVWASRA
jgi:LPXTG-site transpeptidase (sortase) family protein